MGRGRHRGREVDRPRGMRILGQMPRWVPRYLGTQVGTKQPGRYLQELSLPPGSCSHGTGVLSITVFRPSRSPSPTRLSSSIPTSTGTDDSSARPCHDNDFLAPLPPDPPPPQHSCHRNTRHSAPDMAPEGRPAPRGRGRGRGARGRGGRGGASAAAPAGAAQDADPASAAPAPAPMPGTKTPAQDGAADTPTPRAAPTPAARPAAATRGSGSAFGKFLPRAVRRSQLDREAIAQKETQKLEDKAAQDARMKRASRGRGGRRARGGPAGGFQDRVIRGGAGGFGSMIEATSSRESCESRCCAV